MSTPVLLAAGNATTEHRPLIIALFGAFVVATLAITVWAGREQDGGAHASPSMRSLMTSALGSSRFAACRE